MKVLLLSGGSGGHLIPAMTLGQSLRPGDRCVMVSTRRPVDQLLSASGNGSDLQRLEWEAVNLQPFTPLWRWFLPSYLLRQLRAFGTVWSIVRRERPDVVVGFGGYLSAVGVVAARSAGIPTVLHEQNVLPGRANRWLARLANAVAVSFPETRDHLPLHTPIEVTGNPVRFQTGRVSNQKARAFFGFDPDPDRPVLLIVGGSQGSGAINRLALQMWQVRSTPERQRVQVLHLAGSLQAKEVEEGYRRLGMSTVVLPFTHEMEHAYSAATLAVSRAGATGIAEMVTLEVPSILIPYPYAGAHQRANAQWVESIGGAVVLEEGTLTPEWLGGEVEALLSDLDRLSRMREALRARADGSAAERLATVVRKVASRDKP